MAVVYAGVYLYQAQGEALGPGGVVGGGNVVTSGVVVGIYELAVPVEKDKLVEPQVIPHIEHRPYRHKEDDEPEAQPELSPGSNVDNSHFCICFIPELLS